MNGDVLDCGFDQLSFLISDHWHGKFKFLGGMRISFQRVDRDMRRVDCVLCKHTAVPFAPLARDFWKFPWLLQIWIPAFQINLSTQSSSIRRSPKVKLHLYGIERECLKFPVCNFFVKVLQVRNSHLFSWINHLLDRSRQFQYGDPFPR